MKIPEMNWHGWWTIVLPSYILLSILLGYALSILHVTLIFDLSVHITIEIAIIIFASIISIWGYIRYKDWKIQIVIPLLFLDIIFIINTSFLTSLFLF